MAHQTVNNGMTQKIAETVTLGVRQFYLGHPVDYFILYT